MLHSSKILTFHNFVRTEKCIVNSRLPSWDHGRCEEIRAQWRPRQVLGGWFHMPRALLTPSLRQAPHFPPIPELGLWVGFSRLGLSVGINLYHSAAKFNGWNG
jgi:hypothetical protein